MKTSEILKIIGFTVYITSGIVNRFVVFIPDVVYIPIAVVSIALILAGFIIGKKNK